MREVEADEGMRSGDGGLRGVDEKAMCKSHAHVQLF